jgi:hypothetical protein
LTAPPVRQPDQDLGQEQDRYAVVLHSDGGDGVSTDR